MVRADQVCERCRAEVAADALFCPACGAARAKRDGDPLVGEVVADRYLLRERLGHGGSGTIYLAEHVTLRRKVAVKILHFELSRDDLAVERFRREATTVGEIDNEHIVEVHDFGRTRDGRLFLAMELLDGETLADALSRRGRLAVDQVADVLTQLGEALMEAHGMGYVHRDLRPRNVFLARRRGREGFVKLLDFGLAKLVEAEGEAASTSLGMTFGDPRYMSPEQARGDPIDRRADLYSLGVMAYEMLTGAPPFSGKKVFDVLTHHLETEPTPPSAHRPDVPRWLDAVVLRMLAKRPEDRFATVYRLVEALRDGAAKGTIMTDEAAQSMPAIVPPPPAPRSRETGIVRVMTKDELAASASASASASAPAGAAAKKPAPAAGNGAGAGTSGSAPASASNPAAGKASRSSEMSGAWYADGEALAEGESEEEVRGGKTDRVYDGSATDEPVYAPPSRKWIAYAAGGGAAALVIVMIVILATGGGDRKQLAALPPDAAVFVVEEPAPVVADAAPVAAPVRGKPVRGRPAGGGGGGGGGMSALNLRNVGKVGQPDAGVPAAPKDPPVSESNRAQAEFLVKFGQTELKNGDLASAQKNFNKAREFDSRNADALAGLGEVALRQGDFGNAAAHLDAAARLASRSTRIQILRGQAHLGHGDANEAAAAFKAALKVDPDNEVARKGYEEALRRGGQ